MNTSWSTLLLFTTSLLLLQACSDNDSKQAKSELIRPAKLTQVESSGAGAVRQFPATVEPTLDAQLAFRVNGELATINVVAGQEVEQGQILAHLDDKDFKLQVKQAQARYDLTLSQYNRAKQLLADKLVASSVYDEAKAQLDIAEAQLDSAQTNLKYTDLRAPFAGSVAQLHVENFEFIQAKQPIMELQGRDQIDVAIQVPENLMALIPKGDAAYQYEPSLIFDSAPDKTYKVTLREHDITPNTATKSYKVVFSLPTPEDINILSGMTAKLEVEMNKVLSETKSALLVPVEAVFVPNEMASSGRQFVYKVTNENRVKLTEITVLRITQQGAEINPVTPTDLVVTDRIVAAGSHFINDGQQIREWIQERGL